MGTNLRGKMMKRMNKTIKIIIIAILGIIFLFLSAFFAKQCYTNHLYNSKNEVEWETIPKWLIYGGQERYDELHRMGTEHIQESLEKKYANATKIKINDLHVMLEACQQSIDCIEHQNSEYFCNDIYVGLSARTWFEYSGVVMAECNIDGKDFIAYVDLHSEKWFVYDTYQREEIYAAVTEYFDNLTDVKPLYNTVLIEELDVYWNRIGTSYPEHYDMDGACHNYFDGDVEKFLTNNDVRNDIRISVVYNSDKPLPIDEDFIKNVSEDRVAIVRIADKELAKQYADENSNLELHDIWSNVDEAYISRGRQQDFGYQWLWEYKGYHWTPKMHNN